MKGSYKLLSLFLACVLLFSCLGIPAFAATKDNVKHYDTMLAFGSSVARGSTLPGFEDYWSPDWVHGLQGSYPSLVADYCSIPLENRYCCTMSGQTLYSVLVLMGLQDEAGDDLIDLESGSWFSKIFYPAMKMYFGPETENHLMGEDGLIARSDLITADFGVTDILYRGAVMCVFIDAPEFPEITPELLTRFIDYVWDGYNFLKENYPVFIRTVRELNPDADIILVGSFNPLNGVTLTDDSVIPIGSFVSVFTASINEIVKKIAKENGCMYVDTSDTVTPVYEKGLSITTEEFLRDVNHNTHPSAENGNKYIADQVFAVLPEAEPAQKNPTDIVINLGNIRNVSYVSVNGIRTGNYTLDDTTLTIHNNSHFVFNVAVSGSTDGSRQFASYQLVYGENGYTPYRIYGTNDVFKTKMTFLTKLKHIITGILNDITGLFGR